MARAEALDLWICHHFRVLPTEERFKRLTEDQKNILLISWMELSTSEEMRDRYIRSILRPMISGKDAENFKKLGYTDAQVKRIKEQVSIAMEAME